LDRAVSAAGLNGDGSVLKELAPVQGLSPPLGDLTGALDLVSR